MKIDKRRNTDLEKLKSLGGPFTCSTDVRQFMSNDEIPDSTKSSRLYLEIRYCRDSCLSWPKSSDLFKLKRKYNALPI